MRDEPCHKTGLDRSHFRVLGSLFVFMFDGECRVLVRSSNLNTNQEVRTRNRELRCSSGYLASRPPVSPSTWWPVANLRARWISAGVATFGSTLACEQVNPRSVHSDVPCTMPRSFMYFAISATASS